MCVILNRWSKITCVCTAAITAGSTEQSSKNWQERPHSVLHYCWTRLATTGCLLECKLLKMASFSCVTVSAGQVCRMYLVSSEVWQSGESLQGFLRPVTTQCFCPIPYWQQSFVGEATAVLQRRCEQVNDIKKGWKNSRESNGAASERNFFPQ